MVQRYKKIPNQQNKQKKKNEQSFKNQYPEPREWFSPRLKRLKRLKRLSVFFAKRIRHREKSINILKLLLIINKVHEFLVCEPILYVRFRKNTKDV